VHSLGGILTLVESPSELEKELKKLAVQIHLKHYGKGPEEVWVKVHRNIVTFYCSKIITPLEDTLLRISGGREEVLRIREKIYAHIKPHLFLEVEKVSGCKVLSLAADICLETKSLHGSILFLQNIEKELS